MIYRSLNLLVIAAVIMAASVFSSAEIAAAAEQRILHEPLEFPSGDYIEVERELQTTSPAYHAADATFYMTQVNINSSGDNIVGDAANEPSIAVDPTDPSKMVIGWRQFDTINSDFRQAGYGYTTDGGATWTFPGKIEPGIFRSDPVLDSDSDGVMYYNSLTIEGLEFVCDVFRSSDGGATWDYGTHAHGGDKQWMGIDKSGGLGNGHIYAYWTQSSSSCFPGFFTRSTDGGDSYENCKTISGSPCWGTLAVGPEGELYICGDGFVVTKSTNAQDPGQSVSWDFSKNVDLDGYILYGGGPNPGGLLGQAWIAVDNSSGPSRGNVYLLCSVDRYPPSPDPLDVMFARSTDGGVTWSSPVRVNDDPGTSAYQWFGTMSVAPTGRIDAIWLDTRDDPGGYDSALYYSYSIDAGVTWSENVKLSESFNPHLGWPQQQKMGDYFDMVSDEHGVHVAWAATFNGEQDVYYGRITHALKQISLDITSPPPSMARRGTTISWEIEVVSHEAEDCVVDVWLSITSEALQDPYIKMIATQVTVPAGFSGTKTLQLKVPDTAPISTYTVDNIIGSYPDDIYDSDSFTVTVWDY